VFESTSLMSRRAWSFFPAPRRWVPALFGAIGAMMASEPSFAAIGYVQSNSASPSTTVSSIAVAFTGAQTAGDFIAVGVSWGSSVSISSITDTKGNTYTLAVGPTTFSGAASAIYYAKNIAAAAAGANTVTVTFSAATGTPDLRVAEYSGVATTNPLDVTAVSTGTSATSNSGSATTTNANVLLIGSNAVLSGTQSAGTGYTSRQISLYDGNILEDRIVSATGAYSATATLSSSAAWIMQMAAFKAATSGGDTTPPSAPTGLQTTSVTSSQINLSWTASTDNVGVTGYEVWRCQGSGCSSFTRVGTPAGTTYSDAGLAASTSYTYEVRATDAAGNLGPYSSTLATATSAAPTANFIQVNSKDPNTTSVGSVAAAYTAAQVAGDFNVVAIDWGSPTIAISSVTDTKGNAYTLAVGPTSVTGFGSAAIYYAKNIVAAAAGTNTVTVTFASNVQYPDLRIAEYSGIDTANPLDVTATATGTGTLGSSGSATTTHANDLIVGSNATSTGTSAAGTGFTSRVITGFDGAILEDQFVSTTGAYSATAPISPSGQWIMQMAAFKVAGSGGDTSPPSAPTALHTTGVTSSQISLGWTASTDNVGVTGYEVWRCQGSGCSSFSRVGTPTGATFNDSGLSASTSYTYEVRATDAAGNLSVYSTPTLTVTTSASGDTQAPTAPTNLRVIATSSSEVDLSWDAATDNVGVATYVVERCSGSNCSTFGSFSPVNAAPFYDTTAVPSTAYSYRVHATDAAGNSGPPSNVVSITTPASSPDCN